MPTELTSEPISFQLESTYTDSFVNQITLDCLMNKEQYAKYVAQKISKRISNKDKKFYRRRIINVTKELLLPDSSLNILPDVKYVFDNYVKSCVHYFKLIDNNDIIQEEYKDYQDVEMDFTQELESLESINNKKENDALFMRSIKIIKPSLDKFVKKGESTQETFFIPQQKEIDLSNPLLKNKGICKKKNKNNIYEEINK